MRRTFSAYSFGAMRPQHAPGPKPTCASKHGRSTSQFRNAFLSPRSNLRVMRRHSAHDVAHKGTTRRAMSTMSRAARLSV